VRNFEKQMGRTRSKAREIVDEEQSALYLAQEMKDRIAEERGRTQTILETRERLDAIYAEHHSLEKQLKEAIAASKKAQKAIGRPAAELLRKNWEKLKSTSPSKRASREPEESGSPVMKPEGSRSPRKGGPPEEDPEDDPPEDRRGRRELRPRARRSTPHPSKKDSDDDDDGDDDDDDYHDDGDHDDHDDDEDPEEDDGDEPTDPDSEGSPDRRTGRRRHYRRPAGDIKIVTPKEFDGTGTKVAEWVFR